MKDWEEGEFIYLSAVLELLEAAGFDDVLPLMEAHPAVAADLKDTSKWYELLKAAAEKLGLRLKRTETIWDYIKKGGTWFEDFIRLVSLYLLTDVQDSKTRKMIKTYAKRHLKQVNPKEIAAFILQLDRGLFGLTAHIRHILMSVFGIEVATYNKWLDDPTYIEKEFRHVVQVAKARKIPSKHIDAINKLQSQLIRDLKDREVEKKIGKIKHLHETK